MSLGEPVAPVPFPDSPWYRQSYESLSLRPGADWPALLPLPLVLVAWNTDDFLEGNEREYLQAVSPVVVSTFAGPGARLSREGESLYSEELLVAGRLDRGRRAKLATARDLLAWELGKRFEWRRRETYYDTLLDLARRARYELHGFYEAAKTLFEDLRVRVDGFLPCRSPEQSLPPAAPPGKDDWLVSINETRWRDFLLQPLLGAIARRRDPAGDAPGVESWDYPSGLTDYSPRYDEDRSLSELCRAYASFLNLSRWVVAQAMKQSAAMAQLRGRQQKMLEEFADRDYAGRERLLRCFREVLSRIRAPRRAVRLGDRLDDLCWRALDMRAPLRFVRQFEDDVIDPVLDELRAECDRCRRERGLAVAETAQAGRERPAADQAAPPPAGAGDAPKASDVPVPLPAPLPGPPAVPAEPSPRPPAVAPPLPAVKPAAPRPQPPPVAKVTEFAPLRLDEARQAVAAVDIAELEQQLDAIVGGLLFSDAVSPGECVAVVKSLPAGELWIVGDLHADLLVLANLFVFLEVRQRQSGQPWSLVLLGDIIDRGVHSHETLVYLFDRIRRHPGRIAVLLGNHDEDLHWKDDAGFVSSIEPAEYSEQLNGLLKQGAKADDPHIRLARLAERFFSRLPRAAILPNGVMLSHGGFPLTDEHQYLKQLSDLGRASTAAPTTPGRGGATRGGASSTGRGTTSSAGRISRTSATSWPIASKSRCGPWSAATTISSGKTKCPAWAGAGSAGSGGRRNGPSPS